LEYEDFSIKIEPKQGDAYPVIVLNSPAGKGRASLILPFNPDTLVESAVKLEQEVRTRQVVVRDASGATVASLPQRLGEQLFSALFTGDVLSLFDRSIGRMEDQNRGLRIKIHIDPEEPSLAPLLALPWEFLYRKNLREFLNLSKYTPILRDLEVPRPSMPLKVKLPLRILVFGADPIDYPRLDLEDERQKLDNYLSRLQGVQVDYLLHTTLPMLQDRLAEDNYHVLHFMGHGGFDDITGKGVLLLEDENQVSAFVDGGTLGVLLHDYPNIRLVFLNACETARLSSDKGIDPFAGVASALLMAGIPSVVAMQFPISDRAAIIFSNRFYTMLVHGNPVDGSVAEGRRAVRMANPDTMEWGTPVLFNTAPDGVIFTLESQPPGAAAAIPLAAAAILTPLPEKMEPVVLPVSPLPDEKNAQQIPTPEPVLETRRAVRLAPVAVEAKPAAPVAKASMQIVSTPYVRKPLPVKNILIIGAALVILATLAIFGTTGGFGRLFPAEETNPKAPVVVPPVGEKTPTKIPTDLPPKPTNTKVPTRIPTQPAAVLDLAPTAAPYRPPTATVKIAAPLPPTATAAPAQPLFTALEPMFCREGPGKNYLERVTLNTGDVWPVLRIWSDQIWILLEINLASTRTRCCWVSGSGQLNVPRDTIPVINFVPDRIACDLNP